MRRADAPPSTARRPSPLGARPIAWRRRRCAGADGAGASSSPPPPQSPPPLTGLAVCVKGKTCRKQGSETIHRFAVDLALPGLEVTPCGCLGMCGAGPNVALAFGGGGGEPAVARHVATPAAMVSLLRARWRPPPEDSGSSSSDDDSRWPAPLSDCHLQAMQARLAGNAAAVEGEHEAALGSYREALRHLGVVGEDEEDDTTIPPAYLGAHLVRSNMSAALLQMGRAEDAAREARRAERGAPPPFCTAAVRLVDALFALGRFEEAGEAARAGLARHPALRERPEWRQIQGALQQKGVEVR